MPKVYAGSRTGTASEFDAEQDPGGIPADSIPLKRIKPDNSSMTCNKSCHSLLGIHQLGRHAGLERPTIRPRAFTTYSACFFVQRSPSQNLEKEGNDIARVPSFVLLCRQRRSNAPIVAMHWLFVEKARARSLMSASCIWHGTASPHGI